MRIERHKNFLTQDECDALNAWADLGVQNKWLDAGFSKGVLGTVNRVTSRLYPERFEYPQFVRDISDKIRSFSGVSSYGLIEGHGRDGIVVSCTFTGGDVYAHRDPTSKDNLATLRCNVMTRSADAGCVLHIDGQVADIEVGELHCYLASEYEHFATPVEGSTSRVMWMFGAHVPAEDWDGGLIKFGAN
jgi:hypothetical protein